MTIEAITRSEGVVLGLIVRNGPMTPYELKGQAQAVVGVVWPIPHAQLYRDTAKLADRRLLDERTETSGRRRRVFSITAAGRAAFDRWLVDEPDTDTQIRDPAMLKLAFCDLTDRNGLTTLANAQAAIHERWLNEYRRLAADAETEPRRLLLEAGQRVEAAYADFWATLATRSTTS